MTQQRIYGYFERNPWLKVLFLFDRMGTLECDLQDREWKNGYIYKIYEGDWSDLREAVGSASDDMHVVLLFPFELRPDTEEKRQEFPLLEVLEANLEFKEELYEEYLQTYGLPDSMAGFVRKHFHELSTARLSAMLLPLLSGGGFDPEVGCRAMISVYLGENKLLDWESIMIRMIMLGEAGEEKKSDEFYLRLYRNIDARKALDERLKDTFGRTFNPNIRDKMRPVAEVMKYNILTRSIVAKADDPYRALKIIDPKLLDSMEGIYMKGIAGSQYSCRFRMAMERLAAGIREEDLIRTYGTDAPYSFMTERLCLFILTGLMDKELNASPTKCRDRVRMMRLRKGDCHRLIPLLKYIETAASFLEALRSLPSLRLGSTADYIGFYTDTFADVDCLYRNCVELYRQIPRLDEDSYSVLEACKHDIDTEYARIVNLLNCEWLECVRNTDRNLRRTELTKQYAFFGEGRVPKRIVVIVTDVLRYEMAEELMELLSGERNVVEVHPMLSLLPSEARYCLPALFPHRTLQLKENVVLADGHGLSSIRQRTELLDRYKQDAICVSFDEVSTQVNSLRELFKRPLVYVIHGRIDRPGNDRTSFDITAACRKTIDELAKFVYSLHMTLNCHNVVITSCHGFIFNDMPTEERDRQPIVEEVLEVGSRYYVTPSPEDVTETVKFNLEEVSGIETATPLYIATPKGTNRFAAPGGYGFAYGGASLQEMVVPVIYSRRKE